MVYSSMCIFCAVFLNLLGVMSAFSQKNFEEIFRRLQKQTESVGTLDKSGSPTRGIKLIYGNISNSSSDVDSSVHSEIYAPAKPSIIGKEPLGTTQIVIVPTINSSATPVDSTAQPTSVVPQISVRSQPSFAPSIVDGVRPQSSVSNGLAPLSIKVSVGPIVPRAADRIEIYAIAPQSAAANFAAGVTAAPVDHQLAQIDLKEVSHQPVEEKARVDLKIFFEWDSTVLQKELIGQLGNVCAEIQEVRSKSFSRFKIIDHTDKPGSAEYCFYLSTARAEEVERHMIDECAFRNSASVAIGEVERQSSPTAPSGAPSERRVEIQLLI